jgi:20S proteasome alpha/beta subunit
MEGHTMTCIVGLIDNDTVYLGGDSAAVAGWDLTVKKEPKVFRLGPLLIGTTGSCRVAQLLQYRLTVPSLKKVNPETLYRWVAIDLIDAIRECLKEAGHSKKENEQEVAGGNTILVGVAGRLFTIYDDYGCIEPALPYEAVGCGAPYAKGTLWATESVSPMERVEMALRSAETFSAGVRGPFTILIEAH